MRTNHIRTLSVVAITSAGICGCRTAGRLDLTITSVSAESSIPGEYACGDLGHLRVDGKSVQSALSFSPRQLLETDQVVKLAVFQPPQVNYEVLVGADLTSGEIGEAWIVNSDPSVYVANGWAYVWGRDAAAETKWVSVIPDGTTFAVQVVDENHHRVYFIDGSALRVTCKYGSGGTATLNTPDTFVEASYASGSCVLSGATPIAADPPATLFISAVKKIATVCGWHG